MKPSTRRPLDLGLHGQLPPVAGRGQGPLHDRGGQRRPGDGGHLGRVLAGPRRPPRGGRGRPGQRRRAGSRTAGRRGRPDPGPCPPRPVRAPAGPPRARAAASSWPRPLGVATPEARTRPRSSSRARSQSAATSGPSTALGRDAWRPRSTGGRAGCPRAAYGRRLGLADLVEQGGVARVARLVVEADHEVVLGPGGGDVQQPTLLGLLEALVGLADVEVAGGLEVVILAARSGPPAAPDPRSRPASGGPGRR